MICPKVTKGASTCKAPNCNKIIKETAKVTKINLVTGLCYTPLNLPKSKIGIANKINKEANMAITPNNLLGTDLKIA